MICSGCGNKHAYRINSGEGWEICNQCGDLRAGDTCQPDLYLGGKGGIQTCENICDPKTGKPIPFSTKREKKAIMDKLKLRPAASAEKYHGARNEKYLHRKIYG